MTSSFSIGDLIDVQSRTWPGINKPGGRGRIIAIYNPCTLTETYDVKYVLGGKEKNVDPSFVKTIKLEQRQDDGDEGGRVARKRKRGGSSSGIVGTVTSGDVVRPRRKSASRSTPTDLSVYHDHIVNDTNVDVEEKDSNLHRHNNNKRIRSDVLAPKNSNIISSSSSTAKRLTTKKTVSKPKKNKKAAVTKCKENTKTVNKKATTTTSERKWSDRKQHVVITPPSPASLASPVVGTAQNKSAKKKITIAAVTMSKKKIVLPCKGKPTNNAVPQKQLQRQESRSKPTLPPSTPKKVIKKTLSFPIPSIITIPNHKSQLENNHSYSGGQQHCSSSSPAKFLRDDEEISLLTMPITCNNPQFTKPSNNKNSKGRNKCNKQQQKPINKIVQQQKQTQPLPHKRTNLKTNEENERIKKIIMAKEGDQTMAMRDEARLAAFISVLNRTMRQQGADEMELKQLLRLTEDQNQGVFSEKEAQDYLMEMEEQNMVMLVKGVIYRIT